ncbi:MAG: hypothetical protein J1E96_06795 [Ruminococcus sp.]|nr:hypothetical protein [Ruminococcus sp.]
MLTALSIENLTSEIWYKKLLNKLRGDAVRVDIRSARGVALRHITYLSRNGTVNWTRLSKIIGAQRNHLLCGEDVLLPEDMGFRRFDNKAFKIQLASNLGVFVLSKLKNKVDGLSVGIYDLRGDCTRLLSELARYTDNLTVVTDNLDDYNSAANAVNEEIGAVVQVTDNRARLMDCALLIAPEQINELLPLSGNVIVLTSAAPTVCTPGLIYYDYHFRVPNMFDQIKPDDLSAQYFAGALYTKARQYELGSIVPTACSNYASSQTYRSICEHLMNN